MATHSNILAWEILLTEESDQLQFMGLQRVGHDLVTKQQQLQHGYMPKSWLLLIPCLLPYLVHFGSHSRMTLRALRALVFISPRLTPRVSSSTSNLAAFCLSSLFRAHTFPAVFGLTAGIIELIHSTLNKYSCVPNISQEQL